VKLDRTNLGAMFAAALLAGRAMLRRRENLNAAKARDNGWRRRYTPRPKRWPASGCGARECERRRRQIARGIIVAHCEHPRPPR
jgi:hypothetical protein